MAQKTFCDMCDCELSNEKHVFVYLEINPKYYCLNCWKNKKYWPQMHKIEKKEIKTFQDYFKT
jgi:hypothetical protein